MKLSHILTVAALLVCGVSHADDNYLSGTTYSKVDNRTVHLKFVPADAVKNCVSLGAYKAPMPGHVLPGVMGHLHDLMDHGMTTSYLVGHSDTTIYAVAYRCGS